MAFIKALLHSAFISVLWIYFFCPLVSRATFLEVGPQNQTVVEGDRVTLICDLNNDNDNTIFWTYLIKNGRRYISTNDYVYPSTGYGVDPSNYEVIIDQSQQIYTLIIKSINMTTEAGTYDCGYAFGPNRLYKTLALAVVTVSPIPESLSCHLNRLISLGTELNQIFEVACSWPNSQRGEAYFDSSSRETIDVDLRFPNRIISRIESRDTPTIICRFMRDSDAINAPCSGDDTSGLVRVDPFIGEVTVGSSAPFVCTSGNQNYSPEISWDVSVNGSTPFVSQERLIKNSEIMTIVNVQDDDEYLLIECKVHISEDLMVSSYASLRIVEVTTPPARRPPGESQSNRTTGMTERPTTENSVIEITKPVQPGTGGGRKIALAVVIIFVFLIVALVIVIVILVRRRKRGSLRRKYSEGNAHTYDAIELQKIPHTRHDGSSQLYALSFKDKKSKRHLSDGSDAKEVDQGHFKGTFSSSCGMLNLQPESTDEQVYAEPDATTGSEKQLQNNSRRLCNSMPILDASEYETISEPKAQSRQMAKTLSTLSISSNRSSRGDRRWTSQRMKKDAPWTPPMSRHATSFRKPGVKDPNVDSDYTKMTIENKVSSSSDITKSPGRVPLYAKPDKKNKSRRKEISSHDNDTNGVECNIGSDYADIEDVGSRSRNTIDDKFLDTYLSNIPSSFHTSLPKNMKNIKATSLNRAMSCRPAPPKPQRGKCQSMGIPTYSTISDYEIMSKQVKEIKEGDNDYDECDQNEPSFRMSNYDRPRNSSQIRTAYTLPRLTEGSTEAMTNQGYGREGRRVKSLDDGEYELIGNEGGFRKNSTEVPQSPQYADIGDTMKAYASVLDNDVSASEWRQEDDDDDDFDSDFD